MVFPIMGAQRESVAATNSGQNRIES